MKVTLISPYSNITNLGLRLISGTLKRAGYRTQILLLPRIPRLGDTSPDFHLEYSESTINEVAALCKESDLVGISLMSNYMDIAVKLTRKMKEETKALVIWGGIHPSIRPLECLDYADMVCIGEGEDAFLDLVQRLEKGIDYLETQNIWFKNKGNVVRNSLRPLIERLDSLPFPDYDLQDEFVLDKGKVYEMDHEIMKRHLKRASIAENMNLVCYQTMATRGCPFQCTFCCNDSFRRMYKNQKILRVRGHENIISELQYIRERLPFISGVWFSDDSLMSMPYNELEKLCALYKEKIGLPFFCLTLPTSLNEKKMALMVDAGLTMIKMGIQTGSKRALDLYRRKTSNRRVIEATKIINKYKKKMLKPGYDIILDNPYETDEDVIETLELLLQIPKPFRLELYSLTFFPGTELYERAKRDGIIGDDKEDVYRKWYYARRVNYLNLLFPLFNYNVPEFLLRLMINRRVVNFFCIGAINKAIGVIFSVFKKGITSSIRMMRTIPVGRG